MESLGLAPAVVSGAFDNSNKTIAGNQAKRKITAAVNAQDEAYRLPFKYGWKRELVNFF